MSLRSKGQNRSRGRTFRLAVQLSNGRHGILTSRTMSLLRAMIEDVVVRKSSIKHCACRSPTRDPGIFEQDVRTMHASLQIR